MTAEPGREELAAAVLARLTVWYHALIGTGPREVDERGPLLLDLEDGSRRAIPSHEVQEVRLVRAEARTCS